MESGKYGVDKCGLKEYYVTDQNYMPVDFVTFRADGTLVMEPLDGRDRVGQYICMLNARMVEFPEIVESVSFGCDIPACTPVINPNGARGPTKISTKWGAQVSTFDISQELARFTVVPACGFNLQFRTIVLDQYGQPGKYREVQCDDLKTCYVEKCNGGMYTAGDMECDGNTVPYDMFFTVIIQAYLPDGTINESIQFPVEILDPCKGDQIEFRPGIQNFQYTLTTPETVVTRKPTIFQKHAGLCPIECTIRDAAGDQNSIPGIVSLVNAKTGEIRVMNGAKSLADLTFSYELKCTSVFSEVQTGTAINSF